MPSLTEKISSLEQFTQNLDAGKQFRIGKNGQWEFTDESSLIDKIFDRKEKDLAKLPQAFCEKYLYPMEDQPLLFAPKVYSPVYLWKKITGHNSQDIALQNKYFSTVNKAAVAIETAILNAKLKDSDKVLLPMQKEVLSTNYRLEKENGGLDPLPLNEVDPKLVTQLKIKAASWKAAEKRFPVMDRRLTARDEKHMLEMCRYPDFVKLLLRHSFLADSYFTWSIRNDGAEKPFVEYLNYYEKKLDTCFLTSRIGYFGSEILKIIKKGTSKFSGYKKVLTLPIEVQSTWNRLQVKDINILKDNKEVVLNKGWKITIQKIRDIFANKNYDVGDVECFGENGIKNYNIQKLAYWNPQTKKHDLIDLSKPNWWKDLPVLKTTKPTTVQSLKELYPALSDLQPDEWVIFARSSRKNPTLDIKDCHGFMEVLIPNGDGTYNRYPMGVLAEDFPDGVVALIKFLANTVKARVYYPDENIFYIFRQQAAWATKICKEKGIEIMDKIKELIEKARKGQLAFMFGWTNCAYYIQTLLESVFGEGKIPNFYMTSIFDFDLPQPLGIIFNFIRWLPTFLKMSMVKTVQYIFGGWRGMEVVENGQRVYKSLNTSPFCTTMANFLPSMLAQRILNHEISGNVWYGAQR